VFEFYGNYTVLFRLGPHIIAQYGIWVGCGTWLQFSLMVLWFKIFEAAGLMNLVSPSFYGTFSMMIIGLQFFGWRLCSMFLEDKHRVARGEYLTAFLRPGYIEAGGQSIAVITCTTVALALALSGTPPATALTFLFVLTDVIYGPYMAAVALDKLGCVAYGCCWGLEMESDKWYATKYTNPNSKCLRMRPDLKGKPLFPISTLMAALFLKNSLICLLCALFLPYFPGIFTVLVPILNTYDKDIYFPYRGDGGGDQDGYDAKEDFYMVGSAAKRAHVIKWATPSLYIGRAARIFSASYAAYSLFTGAPFVWLKPLDALEDFSTVPFFVAGSIFSFMLMNFAAGYHFKDLGVWLPRSTLVAKAK